MREQAHVIGTKPVIYDSRGWLQLHDCYEGWRPTEATRIRSSWWLVAAGAVVVIVARGIGL